MVAVELGVCMAVALGLKSTHLLIKSDNQGVIGALRCQKSCNWQQNLALRRIIVLLIEHELWRTPKFVPSMENLADAPSRGRPAPRLGSHQPLFPFPTTTSHLV